MDRDRLSCALTISGGSVLLFAVQPIVAKAILPRFGGTAGVWVTCMLFFQVVLLLGYLYAFLLTRCPRRVEATVHIALLIASALVLPWSTSFLQAGSDAAGPVTSILKYLAISIGLPYFLLSANSPLLQSWYAGSPRARFPYGLFAWSNLASLAALLAYPIAIEPWTSTSQQLRWWSTAYLLWAPVVALTALRNPTAKPAPRMNLETPRSRPFLWIALAACASALWLAVANHLSQEVAAIPFLWVLPLSVYLLGFILCFSTEGWYRPAVFRWLLPLSWVAVSYRMTMLGGFGGLRWELPIFLGALLVWCVFCDGELARTKPESPRELAFFYLMIALGGALGAIFVALLAPAVFDRYLELPIAVTGSVLLGVRLVYHLPLQRIARLAVVAVAAFVFAMRFQTADGSVDRVRNFYGSLLVMDSGAGKGAVRSLFNGRTLHGAEYLAPERRSEPIAFYGPESGAGRVLEAVTMPGRRIGVIGLGTGALAGYGRRGDHFRFYEINPAVAEVAARDFHYLDDSAAAIEVVIADGRLAIEREPPGSLDILILDAFSDDSIPVHLLTREAFQAYFRCLRDDGILVAHVTNRYLDLVPVVEASAAELHKRVLLIRNVDDPGRQIRSADWAVVAGAAALQKLSLAPDAPAKTRLWTDDRSDFFHLVK
jgi:SAM-dependent methyltransferase